MAYRLSNHWKKAGALYVLDGESLRLYLSPFRPTSKILAYLFESSCRRGRTLNLFEAPFNVGIIQKLFIRQSSDFLSTGHAGRWHELNDYFCT
jgi:hypothetical protein